MKVTVSIIVFLVSSCIIMACALADAEDRKSIRAIYIPLADHYTEIVAFEKYGDDMKHADYEVERMKNWSLLRAYFMSGEVDVAFSSSPLAMDMFTEKPNSRKKYFIDSRAASRARRTYYN